MHPAGAKPRRFLAVAGNIGAGKSTMVDFLCRQYGFRPFVEPNLLNPYLVDFYADMRAWAFHSQISFLAHKFRLHMELMAEPSTVVQDRTIYEDAEIFAKHLHRSGAMGDRDWRTYTDLYAAMRKALAPPDLLIVLRCSVKGLKNRIKKRGRREEQSIPGEYLESLQRLYEEWFASWTASPVFEVETETLDYIGDLFHRRDLERELARFLP
jgi:deoxyadenosine/deoxycytidine kinase